MKLIPQILIEFGGDCATAFRLYEQCLNGSISVMMTWAESPAAADAPPHWGPKIYHATLKLGDTAIMGGDLPPDRYKRPQGFTIVLGMDDPAAAERAFHALAEGGVVAMPLQETFWAARFGAVVDRFGVTWSINCERPAAPPE